MSSSVYFHFPAHVVVLLRRLVNVVSTLSISNECVTHANAREEKAKSIQSHREFPISSATGSGSLNAKDLGNDFLHTRSTSDLKLEGTTRVARSTTLNTGTGTSTNTSLETREWPRWMQMHARYWHWNRGLLVPATSMNTMPIPQAIPIHTSTDSGLSNDASLSSNDPSASSVLPSPSPSPTPIEVPPRSTRWSWPSLFLSSSAVHEPERSSSSPNSDDILPPSSTGPSHSHRPQTHVQPQPQPQPRIPTPTSTPTHTHPTHSTSGKDPVDPVSSSSSPSPSPSHPPRTPPPPHSEKSNPGKDKHTSNDDIPPDILHQLLIHPALFDPVRTPRYPIVLCHGLYGFDSRGPSAFPSMRMHYWSNVLNILRGRVGAEVIVTSVPGTGFISTRATALHNQLTLRARGRGVNFLAHSMGGLDCRYLISHIRPQDMGGDDGYVPLSLTSVSTPHRGSEFMDWCANNIGLGKLRQQEHEREKERERVREREGEMEDEMMESLGKSMRRDIEHFTADIGAEAHAHARTTDPSSSSSSSSSRTSNPSTSSSSSRTSTSSPLSLSSLSSLPSSFTTLLLSIVDSPAYANLTTSYLTEVFNPSTPDDPRVKYFSVAGRMGGGGVPGEKEKGKGIGMGMSMGMGKGGIGVWHPFWLPKMVLDGVEEREREKERSGWVEERKRGGTGGTGTMGGVGEGEEGWPEGKIPLWADERKWGNDGLVTVQSAQWGEFLGILEGCDHWEMRGARGIELGVDLPAIPAIGLGSFPLASSFGNRPYASARQQQQQAQAQAQGDGWGFGDWTRFVGAWNRSSSAGEVKEGEKEKEKSTSTSSAATPTETSTATASVIVETATETDNKTESKTESKSQKRERERLADDHIVKSSTDTLSVVFDWLIEKVPVSTQILGGGSSGGFSQKDKEKLLSDKDLGDVAVRHMVGGSASSSASASSSGTSDTTTDSPHPPPPPQSEMKKRMDREDKGRNKKRELARKEDLERFYVALARKMYDEGL